MDPKKVNTDNRKKQLPVTRGSNNDPYVQVPVGIDTIQQKKVELMKRAIFYSDAKAMKTLSEEYDDNSGFVTSL